MEVAYDQHFLVDEDIFNKIISISELNENDIVLEIGAGDGRLTKLLLKKCRNVKVIEIDEKFIGALDELKKVNNNLEIYFENALDLIDKLMFNKIISNIPYSITEPLFKKLLKKEFDLCALIIGKNFYDLINSKESKWSLIIPEFFDIYLIEIVPREKFEPKPRVDSALITLKMKNVKNNKLREFILQIDKKVKNALIKILRDGGMTNNQAKEKLIEFKLENEILDENVGHLSNENFFKIVDLLKKL